MIPSSLSFSLNWLSNLLAIGNAVHCCKINFSVTWNPYVTDPLHNYMPKFHFKTHRLPLVKVGLFRRFKISIEIFGNFKILIFRRVFSASCQRAILYYGHLLLPFLTYTFAGNRQCGYIYTKFFKKNFPHKPYTYIRAVFFLTSLNCRIL